MRFRTIVRLLVAVGILGLVAWCSNHLWLPTDTRRDQATRLLRTMTEEVDHLELERGDWSVRLTRRRDDVWDIVQPVLAPANGGRVARILAVLEGLRREEVITAEQRALRDLTLQNFGLVQPRMRVAIGDRFSRVELAVGSDVPLGSQVYAQLAGEDDIVATSADLFNLLPATLDVLRDRFLVQGEPTSTMRIEIQRPGGGFVQLAQNAGQWMIQQPIVARADAGRVARVLDTLFRTPIQEFVWDPPVKGGTEGVASEKPPAAEPVDLSPDTAQLRVTVWLGGEDVGKEILLSRPLESSGELVYARRRDLGSLYTIHRRLLDVCSLSANDVRDRAFFAMRPDSIRYCSIGTDGGKVVLVRRDDSGWMLTEPLQWKADDLVMEDVLRGMLRMRIVVFAGSGSTNRAATAALDRPLYQIAMARSVPVGGGSNTVPRLLIGREGASDTALWARWEDSPELYQMDGADLSFLPANPVDPLAYRGRTVMALAPAEIRRIARMRGGSEQSVLRDESGEWKAAVPGREPDPAAIEDLLLAAANLRALRVEALNPEDLSVYGLNAPHTVITFGLQGGGGIQKSLLLGFRSRTDGLHAMIQGDDVVFVLEQAVVDRLVRDVWLPQGEASPP